MAVIEKRELQEDGHYQVSLYDEEKQKLVHRWSENKNGKKDGQEIEYFEGTDEIKRRTNWRDGLKDGAEEIYQQVDYLDKRVGDFKDRPHYTIRTKTKPQEINIFNKGELISSEKYTYPQPIGGNDSDKRVHFDLGRAHAFLQKTSFVKKTGFDLDNVRNPVIVQDGLTGEINRIAFDMEHHILYGIYGYRKVYDMNFKNGEEYNGYCKDDGLLVNRYGERGKFSYKVEKGLLTGIFSNREWQIEYYEKGLLTKIDYGHSWETWSYNEKGELDGPNICKNDHGETCKECTYKNGKLDGEYKEIPSYDNKRTIDCNYKDGKLDGSYFEETEDTRIECSYKDGNLNGEYKEYKRDEQGNFKLSKECSYKDGVLDGKYIEHANCRVSDHCSGFAWGKLDYSGLVSDLVYKDGQIISGKRYECEPDTRHVKTIYGGLRYIGDPSFVDEESDVKRTKDGRVVYPYIIIKKLYEYENESEYTCISYGDTKSSYWGEISKEHFKDGKLDGVCVDYNKGTTITYKEGKKNGHCSEPTEYGRIESTYKDDVLDGAYTEYFKNGKKRCEGSYSNGEKNGFWKTYADNGDLIEMRRYESGKDVTEHYNKLKKIAAKHIAKEDERSEGKDERVVLKRKRKLGKAIDFAKESIKEKLHDR